MSSLSLRIAQLQVLSKALAHLAHDVQNHLAIINESAGWMEDLIKLKSKQRFGRIGSFFKGGKQHVDPEPYFSSLNSIEKRVNQASMLTRRLSSFAHRLEKNRSVFDGNRVLEEILDVFLMHTEDKGISLEFKLAEEPSMIDTDPSGFQMAVFENMLQVIEGLESGDSLILESEVRDGQFQVRLTSPCPGEYGGSPMEGPDEKDFHWYIIEDLGGQIQKQFIDKKCVITIAFVRADGET